MPWRCVYRKSDGAALSFGTDIDAPVPEGCEAVIVEGPPTRESMWDPAMKGLKDRPARVIPDRLRDLNAELDVDQEIKGLTPEQRKKIDALVEKHYGGWRHRNG